jgi:hypothetical protein
MYSRVMKKELPYKIVGRRDGDVAYILASTDKVIIIFLVYLKLNFENSNFILNLFKFLSYIKSKN